MRHPPDVRRSTPKLRLLRLPDTKLCEASAAVADARRVGEGAVLDLDHVGALVGEQAPDLVADDDDPEVDDAQPGSGRRRRDAAVPGRDAAGRLPGARARSSLCSPGSGARCGSRPAAVDLDQTRSAAGRAGPARPRRRRTRLARLEVLG